MIDRQHGNIVFSCDMCDATYESDDEFQVAWQLAKSLGWRVRLIENRQQKEWVHACPDCRF